MTDTNRRLFMSVVIAFTLVIIFGHNAFSQVAKIGVLYYLEEGAKAYKEKNYAAFLDSAKAVVELRPRQPRYMYNLACAYALNGDQPMAYMLLRRLVAMGLYYPAATDDDLKLMRGTSEFDSLVMLFNINKEPVSHSSTAFTIAQKGLITESVAYDATTKTFYVSSIHKRKVISRDSRGTVKDLSKPGDGLWSAMGMKVDSKRRHLWVATAAHAQMVDFEKGEDGRTGIFKYDLDTGRLLKKYILPVQQQKHWLGDLVVTRSGDVYATDSLNPQIYRIPKASDTLELFADVPQMVSPQGLAFSPDEKSLFLADYSTGIFKMDLNTKKVIEMYSPQIATVGVDGLYYYKGSLIAIQNGTRPHRVVRFRLNRSLDEISSYETLEANNPLFDEPTLGVIVKDYLFYIANSQWGSIDKNGALTDPEKLADPVVLKVKL